MSEDIELHSYGQKVESDSEEYYEIDQAKLETAVSYKNKLSPGTEINFFTHHDANVFKNKSRTKKKRNKKKESQSRSVMDIINSRIELGEPPILKNVINIEKNEQIPSFLERNISFEKIFQVNKPRANKELDHLKRVKLNPNFPNIEKGLNEPHIPVQIQYVEPHMFKSFVFDSYRDDANKTAKFLDISLKNIYFTHHYEFSLEKILTIQLQEYYKKYTEIQDSMGKVTRSIEVNRKTRENLLEKFISITPSKKNEVRFDSTIRKYTEALLKNKDQYLCILKEKRELANIIASIWTDISNVRHKIGTAETSIEVEVINSSWTDDDFSKEWNSIFEIEYSDMLLKYEFEYVSKYLEYKEVKKNNDEAKRNIPKPKLNINAEDIKNEVTQVVDFVLNRNETDIKIYVDDVFVCESERVDVENLTKIDYNDFLTLQILENNNVISIILCENDSDLLYYSININEIRRSSISTEFNERTFICDQIIKTTMDSVGSGLSIKDIASFYKIKLKSSNLFKGKLYTKCNVVLKIGWNDKLSENQKETIKTFINIERQIKRMMHKSDGRNLSTLLEIINNIYDYDIEDQSIIDSLKDMCKNVTKHDDTSFVDESADNVRFKLLSLRNNGGFAGVTNKSIPLFQTQITTEQLNFLQKSEEKDFDVEYFESKRVDMDPIDLQRYMGMRFVDKLNKKITTELNERLLRKTHKDVVMDFKDLSLRSIFANKQSINLDQSSSVKRKQLIEEGIANEQEIHITVLRALNLFDRRVEEESDTEYEDIAGYRMRRLRPFIRISYHGETVQSPLSVGSHPTWNYTAKIKTKLDPLSSLHINIYDEHKVNITQDSDASSQSYRYRCYNKWLGTVAIPMNTVINMGTLYGTFKVTTPPFLFGYETNTAESTSIIPEIMRLMRKDTAFITLRVTTSLSRLGGCVFYNQPTETDDPIIQHLNSFITDYLVDFPARNITLTFIDSTGTNKPVTEFIQSLPLPDIFVKNAKRAESASKSSKSSSSGRKKSTDKTNVRDESVFEIEKPDVSISQMIDVAVRYVSLIPTYELVEPHAVTLKGIELLKVQYGSPLDHTLLLASYFVHLGIKCWVVVGHGLPRGLSSYVLVKYQSNRIMTVNDAGNKGFFSKEDNDKVVVFDAVSGEKHDVRDVGCPLKTVSYVFNGENIWVNVQSTQDCESLSFDFTKSLNWQSVFDSAVFVMEQPPITTNIYSLPGDVENLRNNLEAKIKTKVQKWRWNIRTIWNRYLSNLLRECLPYWEYWSFNPDSEKPTLGHRLKQLMVTYKIFGFPLNMQYLNAKSVVSRVKSTMVHMSDDPKVEFGLAVEVYAYPNNVLSVWVFIASMTRI
ncbi:protein CC2D2B [Colias croceus]|uniref:protein CC2D2B n=1 Tax=Colias crocea TaxID=72248 RepID=UPI001E279F3D|nr:protein CC2D2B [Colias croceus]